MIRRINIWGASGYGKSTLAMDYVVQLKKAGIKVEYVNERAKDWLFEGKPQPTPFDQLYLGGSQLYSEVRALNHTPLIITDSPVHLASIYASFYGGDIKIASILTQMATKLDEEYPSLNILLGKPDFAYSQGGERWQDEQNASVVQDLIIGYLSENNIPYMYDASIQEIKNFLGDLLT